MSDKKKLPPIQSTNELLGILAPMAELGSGAMIAGAIREQTRAMIAISIYEQGGFTFERAILLADKMFELLKRKNNEVHEPTT